MREIGSASAARTPCRRRAAREDAELQVQRRPGAQRRRRAARPGTARPAVNAGGTARAAPPALARSRPAAAASIVSTADSGSRQRLLVAAPQRRDGGAHHRASSSSVRRVVDQHELGIGGRAVVVDAELAHARPLRRAARRPRRSRTRSRPRPRGQQRGHRVEADRDLPDPSGSPPSPRTTERSTATSLGSPVTPTRPPSRSAGRRIPGWASTAASGRCTSAMTPTRSRPLLARQRQVVDVEHRESARAGRPAA